MAHQGSNQNYQYQQGDNGYALAPPASPGPGNHTQSYGAPNHEQQYDPYLPPGQLQSPSQVELRTGEAFLGDLPPPQRPFRDDDDATPIGTPIMKERDFMDESAYPPQARYSPEAPPPMAGQRAPPKSKRNRILLGLLLLIVLLAIVGGLVYNFVFKNKNKTNDPTNPDSPDDGKKDPTPDQTPVSDVALIGRNGDMVTMENGKTFEYKNDFGGYFMDASKTDNPFQDGAQAQLDTPPLNVTWDYGKNVIRG